MVQNEYINEIIKISQEVYDNEKAVPVVYFGNCRPLPKRAVASTCRRLEVPCF